MLLDGMAWQYKDVKSPQIKIHIIPINVLTGFYPSLVPERDILTHEWARTDYLFSKRRTGLTARRIWITTSHRIQNRKHQMHEMN